MQLHEYNLQVIISDFYIDRIALLALRAVQD